MTPRRILLVAATTGYQTRMFEEAAQRLDMDVVLAIDRCVHLEGPWGENAIPVRFENPEQAALLLAAELNPRPDGIVAVGDKPTEIAALAARHLDLRFHPHEAVVACRDKYLARGSFREAGLPVPEYFRMGVHVEAPEFARSVRYPCVLKPLGLSGSRGVIRANGETDFCDAAGRIRSLLHAPEIRRIREEHNEFIHVETYIPGREFAVEGILTGGRLQVLAIFDKPDPLEGPFFEETLYVTPSRESADVQAQLIQATRDGSRALGLTDGPVHAEMRYNESGVWLLEIAARPIGGLCAESLRFAEGVKLEELILLHAVGEDVSGLRRESVASGVMMIPIPTSGIYNGVSGIEEATACADNVVITAQPGQRLLTLPEGASYLGFIFARADTPLQVESALRKAHSELNFDIATELPLI
jgi:biotin carboxylase